MPVKQVLVLRTDLNMRKGKMVAQGAHASMKVFLDNANVDQRDDQPWDQPYVISIRLTRPMFEWIQGKFTKICVGCESEQELLDLEAKAKDAGLPCAAIQDSGQTEFKGVPTWTALAIGPAEAEEIDKITGHLKLL